MKTVWINQKDIDRQQWDELVHQTPDASIYSLSFYLDAVSIDWEAYIAEDFSFAIPIGVVKKGGVSRIYPPLFQRYIEPLGDVSKIDWNNFEKSLLKRYSKGNLHSKKAILSDVNFTTHVHQVVNKKQFKLKTQAKRMIKRFEQTDYEIREKNIDTQELAQLITQELAKKLPLYASKDVFFLHQLIQAAEKKGYLYKVGVFSENVLKGGLIGLKFNSRMLYLKGTALAELQQEGAMYALMNHFINHGLEQGYTIDFGGSKVKGIQFFNQRFNGKDIEYYSYNWDRSPFWFKFIYAVYSKIKKR